MEATLRIAEKTVELNFCKGLPLALGHDLLWFGLTQRQEASAGFDACARSNSDLLLFQIKASRLVLGNGSRRFLAEHDQMQVLRKQVRANRRVFYVLPVIGTTPEICNGLCFSHCSRYLDVSQLPSVIPLPLAKGKSTVRKNNCHYIDLAADMLTATIHSDPLKVNVLSARELAGNVDLSLRDFGAAEIERHAKQGQPSVDTTNDFQELWSSLCKIDRTGLFGAFAV